MSILVLTESQKNTKEPYREVNMHDHTLTGVTGPLHSGCYTEVYSLCTAGPYLFPCGSYTSVASAQAFINLLLLFNLPLFLSLIASHLLKRRKSNVIILPLPLRFCLLFFLFFTQFRSQITYTHSKSLALLPFCHSFLSLLLRRSVLCIFNNFLRWHLKGNNNNKIM